MTTTAWVAVTNYSWVSSPEGAFGAGTPKTAAGPPMRGRFGACPDGTTRSRRSGETSPLCLLGSCPLRACEIGSTYRVVLHPGRSFQRPLAATRGRWSLRTNPWPQTLLDGWTAVNWIFAGVSGH